jgi:hypothetical protein
LRSRNNARASPTCAAGNAERSFNASRYISTDWRRASIILRSFSRRFSTLKGQLGRVSCANKLYRNIPALAWQERKRGFFEAVGANPERVATAETFVRFSLPLASVVPRRISSNQTIALGSVVIR